MPVSVKYCRVVTNSYSSRPPEASRECQQILFGRIWTILPEATAACVQCKCQVLKMCPISYSHQPW